MTKTDSPLRAARAACAHARRFLPEGDVHGPDDVCSHFGVSYTPDQLAGLGQVPWPDDVLRACAGTHLLVAGYPHTIGEMKTTHPDLFRPGGWYDREAFARETRVAPRWHLLRKEPAAGSLYKMYAEQREVLTEDEEAPRACELAHALILHCLATGQRLLSDRWVRTSDLMPDGLRVLAGPFDAGGFVVRCYWDGYREDRLGLASSRKVP